MGGQKACRVSQAALTTAQLLNLELIRKMKITPTLQDVIRQIIDQECKILGQEVVVIAGMLGNGGVD
jgi:hypothetical protein